MFWSETVSEPSEGMEDEALETYMDMPSAYTFAMPKVKQTDSH